ncbi:MAG TPA: hypothetical protein PK813_09305, partial [Candidatus Hydrogenedens sp.]|nr:hypothetical protein [Candidatus Hydrogenedens sp.]
IKKTYDTVKILKKCSINSKYRPTLGQLIYLMKYLNDEKIDIYTDLFIKIRNKLKEINPNYYEILSNIVEILEKEYTTEERSLNILNLRNASAHPGKEKTINWNKYITWLKDVISQPPQYLLRYLVFQLRPDNKLITASIIKKYYEYLS